MPAALPAIGDVQRLERFIQPKPLQAAVAGVRGRRQVAENGQVLIRRERFDFIPQLALKQQGPCFVPAGRLNEARGPFRRIAVAFMHGSFKAAAKPANKPLDVGSALWPAARA
jgi:hypothetical protein